MQEFLFYIFAALAIAAGIAMVLHRNPVYSAIFLIMTLFSLAGFYVLLNAPFIAAVHIIVYAGAIMVLFLFVIMLLNLKRDPARESGRLTRRFVAAVLAIALLVEIEALIGAAFITATNGSENPIITLENTVPGSTQSIGKALFTTYLLPFEIASVLLLVGIIGAVILAKRKLK